MVNTKDDENSYDDLTTPMRAVAKFFAAAMAGKSDDACDYGKHLVRS